MPPALMAEWQALYASRPEAGPFSHPTLIAALVPTAPLHHAYCLAMARDPAGRLRAILPLSLGATRLGGIEIPTLRAAAPNRLGQLGVLCDPERAADVHATLPVWLNARRRAGQRIELRRVLPESVFGAANDISFPSPWQVEIDGVIPFRALGGLDSWHAAVDRSHARTLARRWRRLREAGGQVVSGGIDRSVGAWMEAFAALHTMRQAHLARASFLSDTAVRAAMSDAFATLQAAGLVSLHSLHLNGCMIAGQIVVRAHGHASLYRTSFDPAAGPFGPGQLLVCVALDHAIATGDRLLDFGAGDEPYKRDWTTGVLPVGTLLAPARSIRARAASIIARITRTDATPVPH